MTLSLSVSFPSIHFSGPSISTSVCYEPSPQENISTASQSLTRGLSPIL